MDYLEEIHKRKLLSKIKDIMVEDIISTINIIVERSNFKVMPVRDHNNIALSSYVDGHEGLYPIVNVDVVMVRYREGYIPKLIIIKDGSESSKNEFLLTELDAGSIIRNYKGNIFSRDKNFKTYVLDNTQAERIDLMDEISSIMTNESYHYHVAGVSIQSKRIL